jgi:Holliday junction resolvase RusA-like endonuclease
VVDALNGIVWRDDAQIVSLFVRKVYAETPGLDIVIRPYVNPSASQVVSVAA